jgi:dolichyl-phosphate beta-glucosyltransferase
MTRLTSDDNRPLVSLVIPAYNEERRIGASLKAILRYLDENPCSAELIVVDDGSEDQTWAVARECLDGDVCHKILRYRGNRGKGYAVKTGALSASGRYIVFMDADLSTPIEELGRLTKALDQGYDVAIGTRKHRDALVKRRQPLYRELLGKAFTLLSNILVARHISDITCGFKGFKREVARDILQRQSICNWSFDAEILFLAQRLGYSIKEVPVTWFDVEGTRVRLSRDILGSLEGILQIRINHLLNSYRISRRDRQ